MTKPALLVLVSFVLAACHSQPAPTPFPKLPAVGLERVKVSTIVAGHSGIWVPENTLLLRAGIHGVFVEREGRARFQMVKPGQRLDNHVQILSGLYGVEILLSGELGQVHDGSPLVQERQER
jgi:hypothetical protein